jgi:dihydrofolate reductase
MRRIITTMQVTLDGKTERPDAGTDWIGTSADSFDFEVFDRADTCVLGRVMYPEYEQYWRTIVANPTEKLEATGAVPSAEEVRYAQYADRTPHYVLSRTATDLDWPVARAVSDIAAIRALRDQPGGDIYVVGGAATVTGFLNEGLLDELRLTLHPMILGEGTSLFGRAFGEHLFELVEAKPLSAGRIRLIYHAARGRRACLDQAKRGT